MSRGQVTYKFVVTRGNTPMVVVSGGRVMLAPHLCEKDKPGEWYLWSEIDKVLGIKKRGARGGLLKAGVLEKLDSRLTVDGRSYYRFADDYTRENWYVLAELRGLLVAGGTR